MKNMGEVSGKELEVFYDLRVKACPQQPWPGRAFLRILFLSSKSLAWWDVGQGRAGQEGQGGKSWRGLQKPLKWTRQPYG